MQFPLRYSTLPKGPREVICYSTIDYIIVAFERGGSLSIGEAMSGHSPRFRCYSGNSLSVINVQYKTLVRLCESHSWSESQLTAVCP